MYVVDTLQAANRGIVDAQLGDGVVLVAAEDATRAADVGPRQPPFVAADRRVEPEILDEGLEVHRIPAPSIETNESQKDVQKSRNNLRVHDVIRI